MPEKIDFGPVSTVSDREKYSPFTDAYSKVPSQKEKTWKKEMKFINILKMNFMDILFLKLTIHYCRLFLSLHGYLPKNLVSDSRFLFSFMVLYIYIYIFFFFFIFYVS